MVLIMQALDEKDFLEDTISNLEKLQEVSCPSLPPLAFYYYYFLLFIFFFLRWISSDVTTIQTGGPGV